MAPRNENRPSYMVELPDDGLDVTELTARARELDRADARFLRTVYVPESGRCYLLLEAENRRAAAAAARSIGGRTARVTDTIDAARKG